MIHKVLEVCRKLPFPIGPMPNLRDEFLCSPVDVVSAAQRALLRVLCPSVEQCHHTSTRLPETGEKRESQAHRVAQDTSGSQNFLILSCFPAFQGSFGSATQRLATRFKNKI